MADILNTRTVELYNTVDGKWFEIDAIYVKRGDIFRMFEPDGTPVLDDGSQVFVCQSDARYNDDGVVVIAYDYNGI